MIEETGRTEEEEVQMITKHRITEAYSIQQTCDKCNTIMLPSVYNKGTFEKGFEDSFYTSTCPKCGNVVNTGATPYPYTRITYSLAGEEVREEDGE